MKIHLMTPSPFFGPRALLYTLCDERISTSSPQLQLYRDDELCDVCFATAKKTKPEQAHFAVYDLLDEQREIADRRGEPIAQIPGPILEKSSFDWP